MIPAAVPVRVFIGSGEASVLACRTLVHSLRRHTQRCLDIWVFNGTHNAVEHNDDPPVLAPLSLRLKYRQKTEFTLYRYLIPELCQYQGRAIYLDSDMVCLEDIGELFDAALDGYDFLAKADAHGPASWTSSVMLIDCARARFDLEAIFDEIDRGCYSLTDFNRFSPAFCRHHLYSIGPIDPRWNEFDRYMPDTKLIHYTDMRTQPWKVPNHPFGDLWCKWFRSALGAGLVTRKEVVLSVERGVVRPDILDVKRPRCERFRRWLRGVARYALSACGLRPST